MRPSISLVAILCSPCLRPKPLTNGWLRYRMLAIVKSAKRKDDNLLQHMRAAVDVLDRYPGLIRCPVGWVTIFTTIFWQLVGSYPGRCTSLAPKCVHFFMSNRSDVTGVGFDCYPFQNICSRDAFQASCSEIGLRHGGNVSSQSHPVSVRCVLHVKWRMVSTRTLLKLWKGLSFG